MKNIRKFICLRNSSKRETAPKYFRKIKKGNNKKKGYVTKLYNILAQAQIMDIHLFRTNLLA